MSKITEFDSVRDIEFDKTASERLGREYWRLLKPFSFYYKAHNVLLKVVVPAGYLACGKTIPAQFWELASPMGKHPQLGFLDEYLRECKTVYIAGTEHRVGPAMIRKLLTHAVRVLKAGAEGHRMIAAMQVVHDLETALETPVQLKNNAQDKSYGNNALQCIRSFLNKERKEPATC